MIDPWVPLQAKRGDGWMSCVLHQSARHSFFFRRLRHMSEWCCVQESIRGFSQVAKVMRSARPSLSVVHCACRSRYQVLMLKTIVSTVEQV